MEKKKKLELVFTLYGMIAINIMAGLTALYSSGGIFFLHKQLINLGLACIVSVLILFISVRIIYRYAYYLYFINLLTLLYVQLFGHNAMGATRWINIFGIKFQPSENTKIVLILALAKFLETENKIDSIRKLLVPAAFVAAPFLLIVKQPDLGTGLIIMMVSSIMILMSNVSTNLVLTCIKYSILSLPVLWFSLHDYQKKRIMIFIFNDDKMNSGYNVYQSQIAIGSGGKFGAGFQLGSQSQLGFLPENHTDFIFSSFAEEFGLFISICIIIVYYVIIYCLWRMILCTESKIYRLTITGLSSLFFLHCFINMGMVMNLLPVVGIPLPFFSYGGTTLISVLALFSFCTKLYIIDDNQKEYSR